MWKNQWIQATDRWVTIVYRGGSVPSGTAFYDRTMYQAPRGDYHVYEDSGGSQWYAIPGTPTVERRPVYEDGKPVYDGDKLQTTMVETMRYKSTPSRHTQPQKRPVGERKPPNRKKP